ncbi:MAG: DUF1643 domain-containing protein [Pseudomonadota bacterium]
MIKTAFLNGDYRYFLARQWEPSLPVLVFVMLNPSTADHEKDDPTIRRCIRFAVERGYGGLVVVNLMAYRATDPNNLPMVAHRAIGPRNAEFIRQSVEGRDVVVAWGAHRRATVDVVRSAAEVLHAHAAAIYCLGRTKDGSPRHPLYVRADQPFEVFSTVDAV